MSKVKDWIACDLRYVGEAKLARLTDEELEELHAGLLQKHGKAPELLADNRQRNIGKILLLKKEISTSAPAPSPAPPPLAPGEQAVAEQGVIAHAQEVVSAEAPAPAPAPAPAQPHEEHDAQGTEGEGERLMTVEEKLSEAAKAFDQMFADEVGGGKEKEPEPEALTLTPEEAAAKRDREERASAFIQLAAAASASPPVSVPVPVPTGEPPPAPVTVDTHRLRVCSFNACKMRLGNANKPYREGSGPPEAYEGSHKGAELTQKWLTLSAIMSDFDVIMLQEVPGTEKVLNEKIEKFAAMLDVATEEGRFWTAIHSEKSGKDGQVTGPSAEVHVCFVKSPVELKSWNTLRKVGCTELDYAPLQVVVHDARFAEVADRDFVVTSVHLPPSKRRDARDSQIAALIRNYAAPDTSEYRMQLPFGPNKETRQAPVHLICGDFNTFPGHDKYQLQTNGFVSKIPKNAATTSGHENYDNVLVNAHANDEFLIGGGILQLKDPHNASQSQIGLSDHFPVFVEVSEVLRTKRPAGARGSPGPSAPMPIVELQGGQEAQEQEEAQEAQEEEAQEEEEPSAPPPLSLNPVPEEQEEEADDDDEATEEAVREVVHATMDRVKEAVIQAAAKEEEEGEATAAPLPPIEASKEQKRNNPNYNLDQHKPEFTDDSEEESDALTDGPPDLPRSSSGSETESDDRVNRDPPEAPAGAGLSTQEQPATPPPPPELARDAGEAGAEGEPPPSLPEEGAGAEAPQTLEAPETMEQGAPAFEGQAPESAPEQAPPQ